MNAPEPDAPKKPSNTNVTGIVLMMLGAALLTAMDGTVKLLVMKDFSPFQILAVRGWIIFVLMAAWILPREGLDALKTKRWGWHLGRSVIGFAAPFLFFLSFRALPLADATVIFFGATFIMTAASALFLKERVGAHRWAAVFIGFTGVVIAANPGTGVFQVEALYALCASVTYAFLVLSARWIGDTEPTFRMVFYYNLGLMVIATLVLPFVYKPMSMEDLGIILAISILAFSGHICLTRAFVVAPVGVIAPFEYTSLIWAALFGFVLFADIPAPNVWIGAAVIVMCGLYVIARERRSAKIASAAIAGTDPIAVPMIAPEDDVRN